MIQLIDMLKAIENNEKVKIIDEKTMYSGYSGITGDAEELRDALKGNLLQNYVKSVTYDDAAICIYTTPDNPYSEDLDGNDEDDGTNGWRCVDDELPKHSDLYLALCRKPDDANTIYRYEISHFDRRSKDWTTNNVILFWHELPKYKAKRNKA